MIPQNSTADKTIKPKTAALNIIMVATAFVWYLLAFDGLKELLIQANASANLTLLVIGINTGGIIIAGLIGTLVVNKFKSRNHFLTVWLAIGVIVSLIPIVLKLTDITQIAFVSALFGLYFGFGMPTTMGYHSSYSKIENRARIGGFTFLIIGVSFALSSLFSLGSSWGIYLLLAAIKIVSLVLFKFVHIPDEPQKKSKITYSNVLNNRSFILYFVPWLMFSLINFMTMPIQNKIYPSDASFAVLTALENGVIAVVAIISGFIADKMGRKRLTIIGFIMIGIGYAVIALFSNNLMLSSIIFTITDGTAWGIFYMLFLFTIWGDIGQLGYSDKFYFLGALPYVSSYFMRELFTQYLQNIDVTLIFSFASIFLFIAVLPLIYAPETLPEKLMKDRDLKSYIENAQKKATKQNQNKYQPTKEEKTEAPENDASYEEAKKLAEKYY
jgi:MFS family permease